jgi:uncharacterized membrane protein YfcA
MSVADIAAITAIFLIAGVVKGVSGLGLVTLAMGLLALIMHPADAAVLLLIPTIVTNLWQLFSGSTLRALTRRFWTLLMCIVIAAIPATAFLTGAHAGLVLGFLGAVLTLYTAITLWGVEFRVTKEQERWLSPLIGLVTGLTGGATGVFVMPVAPYLQSLHLGRDALVQSLALSFTVSVIALAIGLFREGAIQASPMLLVYSLATLAPALAGVVIGQALRTRITETLFRAVFLTGLLLLGLYLVWKGFG